MVPTRVKGIIMVSARSLQLLFLATPALTVVVCAAPRRSSYTTLCDCSQRGVIFRDKEPHIGDNISRSRKILANKRTVTTVAAKL